MNAGARQEGLQIEAGKIESPGSLGIGSKENLETTIQQESVKPVRAHTSTHTVLSLQDQDVNARGVQPLGASQT